MDQNQFISISRPIYSAMLAHLQEVFPLEGCGFLAGRDGEIRGIYPIDNILRSPYAYEMNPGQQVRAMLAIEAEACNLLAIYHSHPNGPEQPSPTDVARAYYPEAVYLIVSLADREAPSVRAFSIVDDRVEEVRLRIV